MDRSVVQQWVGPHPSVCVLLPVMHISMSSLPPPVPGEVGVVLFTGLGDNGVQVSWQRPRYPNGIISSYRVTVEYYEHSRGTIYRTEVDNETLSTTIQHHSLGGYMFIRCYNISRNMCHNNDNMPSLCRAWCSLQWNCSGHQSSGKWSWRATAVLHQRAQ